VPETLHWGEAGKRIGHATGCNGHTRQGLCCHAQEYLAPRTCMSLDCGSGGDV
jgi:hypothetical protein